MPHLLFPNSARLLVVPAIAGLLAISTVGQTKADPLVRGVQGAIGGAVVGGIIGGGKGAGRGALIGGGIGIVGGAIERDRRRRAARNYGDRPRPRVRHARRTGLVYNTQRELQRLGYAPGGADGVMGRRTSTAIGDYQADNGLLETGRPSQALLAHMARRGS